MCPGLEAQVAGCDAATFRVTEARATGSGGSFSCFVTTERKLSGCGSRGMFLFRFFFFFLFEAAVESTSCRRLEG